VLHRLEAIRVGGSGQPQRPSATPKFVPMLGLCGDSAPYLGEPCTASCVEKRGVLKEGQATKKARQRTEDRGATTKHKPRHEIGKRAGRTRRLKVGADKVWKPREAEGKDNLLLHTRDTERFPRSGQTVINERMKLQSWRYALRESAALASACLSGSHSADSQGRKNRHRVTRASHLRLLSELQQKTRRTLL